MACVEKASLYLLWCSIYSSIFMKSHLRLYSERHCISISDSFFDCSVRKSISFSGMPLTMNTLQSDTTI